MIVTIDGPTASGKSTIARMLARDLDCYYLYSGLLYRALGYLLVHEYHYSLERLARPNVADVQAVLSFPLSLYTYDSYQGAQIHSRGVSITHLLKTPHVDRYAYIVSAHPYARAAILEFQRMLAQKHTLIADGRDCGTVVFPHAEHKFFLTADPEVRARRWQLDQLRAGKDISFSESLAALLARDGHDTSREHSPLVPADNAKIIDNSALDLTQTLALFTQALQVPSRGTIVSLAVENQLE